MALRRDVTDNGSWPYAEELYQPGDPLFVAELRLTDADRLGNLAARWYADPRPEARLLLLTYLDQPLNSFRHKALVELRLFKLAEAAGDDEVMGWFLAAFDRSLQQLVSGGSSAVVATRAEAKASPSAGATRAPGRLLPELGARRRGRCLRTGLPRPPLLDDRAAARPRRSSAWRPPKDRLHGPCPSTRNPPAPGGVPAVHGADAPLPAPPGRGAAPQARQGTPRASSRR